MRLALALVLICSPVAAQDTKPEGPRPDRVQISPGVVDAEVGQTIRFTATAYDASGTVIAAKPTAWFGAPFDVGAADEEGLVTVFAPGELKVGAIVNGKTGWATIRIKPQQVSSVAISAAGGAAGSGSVCPARRRDVHQGRRPARGRRGVVEVRVAVGGDGGRGRRRDGARAGTRDDPRDEREGHVDHGGHRRGQHRAGADDRTTAVAGADRRRRAILGARRRARAAVGAVVGRRRRRHDRSRRRLCRRAPGHVPGHRRLRHAHRHVVGRGHRAQRAARAGAGGPHAHRGLPDARAVDVRRLPVCDLRALGQAVGVRHHDSRRRR